MGAITHAGVLINPLYGRFGIVARLGSYTPAELVKVVTRSSGLLDAHIVDGGALETAKRPRGTPHIANHLLRHVRGFAEVKADGIITREVAGAALAMLDADMVGLDPIDRKLLEVILREFNGGPVDINNLTAATGEKRDTIEDVLEPYLIQQGCLQRTPRDHVTTASVYQHLGLGAPKSDPVRDPWDGN